MGPVTGNVRSHRARAPGVLGFGCLVGAAWDIAKTVFRLAVLIAVTLLVLVVAILRKVTRSEFPPAST